MLNRIDRPAAEYGFKTPDQVLPAMGAGENVDVVTERGHDLGLQNGRGRESYGAAQHLMGDMDPRRSLAWCGKDGHRRAHGLNK
jgi:hypothetical protein